MDIVLERWQFIEKINSFLAQIYCEITNYNGLFLKYISNVEICNKKELMLDKFQKKLSSIFEREKDYGMTLLGPHRDDFSFLLDGRDLSIFGSQGQIRAALLALKLSEILLFKEEDGDYPILLLDDIFSELDVDKKSNFLPTT